jgi:hypothetical protein
LYFPALREKEFCAGRQVVIVKGFDWLVMEVPCIVATTQTGVGTVPEERETDTSPLESDVAEVSDNVIPPGAVVGDIVKSTRMPGIPLLVLSTTLNFTRELVGKDEVLAVLVPMIWGSADTNWILL